MNTWLKKSRLLKTSKRIYRTLWRWRCRSSWTTKNNPYCLWKIWFSMCKTAAPNSKNLTRCSLPPCRRNKVQKWRKVQSSRKKASWTAIWVKWWTLTEIPRRLPSYCNSFSKTRPSSIHQQAATSYILIRAPKTRMIPVIPSKRFHPWNSPKRMNF